MLRKTTRSVGLAATALLLTTALAACGNSKEPANEGSPSNSTPATDTSSPAAADATESESEAPEAPAADDYKFAKDEKTLVWGVIPSEDSATLEASFKPIEDLIAQETGKHVELFKATSYAAMIEALMAGKVDVASMTPMPYVVAINQGAQIEPIAIGVNDKGVPSGYRGYAFVPAGSDIKDINGFKGKKVCMVEPTSTSGGLYPRAALLEHGIDPEADITPVWAGTHDASILNVLNGTCDAGFAYDTMITEILPAENPDFKPEMVDIVYETGIIPAAPIVVPAAMPADLKDQLTDIFQNKANVDWLQENGLGDGSKIGDGPYWGFEAPTEGYYDPIVKVCELTKAEACTSAG